MFSNIRTLNIGYIACYSLRGNKNKEFNKNTPRHISMIVFLISSNNIYIVKPDEREGDLPLGPDVL